MKINRMSTMTQHVRTIRSLALVAFAVAALPAEAGEGFVNPLQSLTLYDFLLAILNSVVFIMFPVIVLMLVYTGFLFVSAQGKPEKLSTARKVFIWTLIGGLVILGSKALALAIQATVEAL